MNIVNIIEFWKAERSKEKRPPQSFSQNFPFVIFKYKFKTTMQTDEIDQYVVGISEGNS